MERTQFTFCRSFFRAIGSIPKKADRCDAYEAIIRYAPDGEEPKLRTRDTALIFEIPVPDSGRRKAAGGRKAGLAARFVPDAP